jgi:thiol:disulfide interchange protein DsbD
MFRPGSLLLTAWVLLGAGALSPDSLAAEIHAAGGADLDAVLDASHNTASADEFLPPDQAFQLSATAGPDAVRLDWVIAKGYYLYRDRTRVAADGARIGAAQFPAGQIKNDEYFGQQVVYHDELIATVPLKQPDAAGALALRVTYQGCAEAGLCYPPITRTVSVSVPGAAGGASAGTAAAPGATVTTGSGRYVSEQDRLAGLIRDGSLAAVLATFFGLGLLLAFTPCVLPMVPILSGLIVGQAQRVTSRRAFALSLTYVLGMAITYTIAGAVCAAAGAQVQAIFQRPWIIVLFATLFVLMAGAMFGFYTVQMPAFLQTRIAQTSNRQRAGSYGGVALMGMLSALIVTACVAPALVATLVVIGQSGDVPRGAAALFALSLGMGAPLLLVGASAGRWLPRAGPWMDTVKHLFGVMMLALAAWMLTRLTVPPAALLMFIVPALAAAWVLWRVPRRAPGGRHALAWPARLAALAAAGYAIALMIGAAGGADDPLRPLARAATVAPALPFHAVESVAQLHREVATAAAAQQPVMLDIDADWCVSCKEMERYTFTDPEVRRALGPVRLLRANVTANSPEDQALLREFGIFGPPTIAFYDAQGRERRRYRVVGYMKAADFAALLHRALGPEPGGND